MEVKNSDNSSKQDLKKYAHITNFIAKEVEEQLRGTEELYLTARGTTDIGCRVAVVKIAYYNIDLIKKLKLRNT